MPGVFQLDDTHRFADPRGQFQEAYAGTTIADAVVEKYDHLRVDALAAQMGASVRRPVGPRFARGVGTIPRSELEDKAVLVVRSPCAFVDVMQTATQTWLSTRYAVVGLLRQHFGLEAVDSGVMLLPGSKARAVTQQVSRVVHDDSPDWAGIRYTSRIGSGHENWMVYDRAPVDFHLLGLLDADAPEVREAIAELGLTVV